MGAQHIIGHGIDLVEIARVQQLFNRASGDVPGAWFTAREVEEAPTDLDRTEYFAGRIAAKEAVVKALGTGLVGDMAWTEVEVLRAKSGIPRVALTGAVAQEASSRGVDEWLVSISHTDTYAVASVIAVRHDSR